MYTCTIPFKHIYTLKCIQKIILTKKGTIQDATYRFYGLKNSFGLEIF